MKLSEEIKHCLDSDGCSECECFETKSVLTCRGLLQAAYEEIKKNEEAEEKSYKTLEEMLESCCCELRQQRKDENK